MKQDGIATNDSEEDDGMDESVTADAFGGSTAAAFKKKQLPRWHYEGQDPSSLFHYNNTDHHHHHYSMIVSDAVLAMNLGNYRRLEVSNVDVEVDSVDNDVDDDKSRMLLDESDTNNCNGNATPAETEKNSPTKSRMTGRMFFDVGMRLLMSYQHELAAHCFLACLQKCPDAALAHGLLALCHSPNYNFKGDAYYESACHYDEALQLNDLLCVFPSQQVADRHSAAAMETVEALKRRHKHQNNQNNNNHNHKKKNGGKKSKSHNNNNGTTANHHATANNSAAVGNPDEIPPTTTTTTMISDVERMLLAAIRILTGTPGVDPTLSNETVGRPYAQAMRKVYQKYPSDPEVAYFFAESLMVLNAWQLYEYPSGKPVSVDVVETRAVLECALQLHPHHAGLSHMYVHLSEMSAHPELALPLACQSLRHGFPHAGHLIHMPTHIDVLTGDYESCVRYNLLAIEADRYAMECSPATAGRESFYFGYIVHDYHMAVYGAILGGMERKGMEVAEELNEILNEATFRQCPSVVDYLESYSALEIHVLIRFGRWKKLLEVELPTDKHLMLYRTASIRYGRALAYAMSGDLIEAGKEADRFDTLRLNHSDANVRILHNNTVADLLAVDANMMRGEIAYRQGRCAEGLDLLRKAVDMQENLNYDEPWGKMQPIRHALGGLLLEKGNLAEAESVFRKDLKFHPRNPWALIGLIRCLKLSETQKVALSSTFEDHNCRCGDPTRQSTEISQLEEQLRIQRQMEWADYNVVVACECCIHSIV